MNIALELEFEKLPVQEPLETAPAVSLEIDHSAALVRVVQQVKADAQQHAQDYLEGSIVPAGGE